MTATNDRSINTQEATIMRPAVRSRTKFASYSYTVRVEVRVPYSATWGATLDAPAPSRAAVIRGVAERLQRIMQGDEPGAEVTVAIDGATSTEEPAPALEPSCSVFCRKRRDQVRRQPDIAVTVGEPADDGHR